MDDPEVQVEWERCLGSELHVAGGMPEGTVQPVVRGPEMKVGQQMEARMA